MDNPQQPATAGANGAATVATAGGPATWRGGPPWAGPPWGRGGRWQPRPRRAALGMAVAVAVLQLVGTRYAAHHQGARHLDWLGYLLLIAGPAALAVRRRWRVPVLVTITMTTLVYYLLGYPYGPDGLALVIALFGTVRTGHRVAVWITCALGYAAYLATGHLVHSVNGWPVRTPTWNGATAVTVWLLIILALAELIRVRTAHFAEIARTRAEQARARAEQQRRQASEERLRMARELHDVLGHHLSLINVQAGVGLHLMDERPEQARTALLAIKQASAEALREVRSVLGILREEDERAPRAPAPSLANLADLVAAANAELSVTGTARPLAAELDRAAYRIAQEALTNVRRHAGPRTRARVTIGYHAGELLVRVDDEGPGPAPPEPGPGPGEHEPGAAGGEPGEAGNGIAGMRARAAALGGSFSAGPGPRGGFRVEARLPLPAGPEREDE